jgi:hypothetical protein
MVVLNQQPAPVELGATTSSACLLHGLLRESRGGPSDRVPPPGLEARLQVVAEHLESRDRRQAPARRASWRLTIWHS